MTTKGIAVVHSIIVVLPKEGILKYNDFMVMWSYKKALGSKGDFLGVF